MLEPQAELLALLKVRRVDSSLFCAPLTSSSFFSSSGDQTDKFRTSGFPSRRPSLSSFVRVDLFILDQSLTPSSFLQSSALPPSGSPPLSPTNPSPSKLLSRRHQHPATLAPSPSNPSESTSPTTGLLSPSSTLPFPNLPPFSSFDLIRRRYQPTSAGGRTIPSSSRVSLRLRQLSR